MKILAIHPFILIAARLPHTQLSHAGLLHKGQASGAATHMLRRDHHAAVTAKKCILHLVPPRGVRKSLCFFQLHQITQNHPLPFPKGSASLRYSQPQHYCLKTRERFQPAKPASWNRSRPRSRLNAILLDSLKLLPSPFSLTSRTARKTIDSFSICAKLLYSFMHL